MLPRSDVATLHAEPQITKPPKSPGPTICKNPLHNIRIYILAHPRSWLLILLVLLVQLLLFFITSSPISDRSRLLPPRRTPDFTTNASACSLGMVYVYDLPRLFNEELYGDCASLSPFGSRCAALSHGGFGPPAAVDLAGIIPNALLPAWWSTDQFAAEILFHRRILRHPCRTRDPLSAAAFFVPFYGGLAVGKYLWSGYSASDRDRHCRLLLDWLSRQPPWAHRLGRDHFLVLARITWDFRRSRDGDWGSSFLHMPQMRNVTRLLIERNPWDDLDVGVPYPTGFHPRSDADVVAWRDFILRRPRPTQFCFAGAPRAEFKDDFRALLLSQCSAAGVLRCRSVDCSGTRCSNSSAAAMRLFLDSEFCLQPRGDSFTRRSIFDCMIAGSIPVFFWRRSAYAQYPWFLPAEPESYSVFIDRRDVKNGTSIRAVLDGLGPDRTRRMREKIVEFLPKFLYAAPDDGLETIEDAFDVGLRGVLMRFREMQPGGGGGGGGGDL